MSTITVTAAQLHEAGFPEAARWAESLESKHSYSLETLLENRHLTLLNRIHRDNPCVRIRSGRGVWWRAGGHGYTDQVHEAGVYTFEEAWKASSHCGPEKGIVYEVLS